MTKAKGEHVQAIMTEKDSLGLRLALLRTRSRRQAKSIAREIGISREFLSYLENNKRMPSPKTLEKLAKVYGRTVEEVIKDTDAEEKYRT